MWATLWAQLEAERRFVAFETGVVCGGCDGSMDKYMCQLKISVIFSGTRGLRQGHEWSSKCVSFRHEMP